MKLPTLKSAPVQRLETPSAEVAAAPFRALGDIGRVVGGEVDQYIEDKNRKEAETEVMRTETDSKNQILGVHQELSAPAINVQDKILRDTSYRDSDIIEGADGEFYVPTHKVSGEILEREQTRIYQEQTGKLTSDLAKDEYDRRWSAIQQRSVEAGFKQTQKALQVYTLGESMRAYDEALSLGNHDGAREALFVAWKDGGLSQEKYRSAKLGVDKKEETDPINQHLATNDKDGLIADLEMLKDRERDMALSWDERETMASEIESELSAISKRESATQEGLKFQFFRNTERVITSLESGERISPNEVADTKTVIDELSRRDDLSDKERGIIADFNEAWAYRDQILEFQKRSPAEQADFLQKQNAKELSANQIDLVNRLEKVHDATVTALNTDSMSYVENALSMEIPPLNFDDIARSLSQRQIAYDATIAQFGTASGYLKEQESALVAERLSAMGSDEVIAFAGQVEAGLGDNAIFFWEQLKQKNVGAVSVAGQMHSMGMVTEAKDVVFGNKLLKDKSVVFENNKEITSPIRAELGTAYAYNNTENTYREQAILGAYAAIAWRNGETETGLNSDWLDQAIETVTGGVFEINGVKLTAPQKGITEDRMQQWVDNMAPDYIRSNGGSPTMPPEQVSEDLKDGSLQIVPSSANTYFVRVSGTDTYLQNNDGMPLELPYDDSFLVSNAYRNVRDIRR